MDLPNSNIKKCFFSPLPTFPLFPQKYSFFCINPKHFDVWPSQQQRNLNPILLLREVKTMLQK